LPEYRLNHFLPESYLKQFTRPDGALTTFDRQTGSYKPLPPKKVGAQADLYTFTDGLGVKNRQIERILFQIIDDSIQPVFLKLAAGQCLTHDERGALAMFAAFQITRVPEFHGSVTQAARELLERVSDGAFADAADVAGRMKAMESRTGNSSTVTPEALIEAWQSRSVRLTVSPKLGLGAMLHISPEVAELLMNFDWTIMVAARNRAFVLSDNPFAIVPSRTSGRPLDGVGLSSPGALKYLPLTKHHCLRMGKQGYGFRYAMVDSAVVRVININTARNSRRFLYGISEEHLKKVVKPPGRHPRVKKQVRTSTRCPAAGALNISYLPDAS
jgi:hypothetical protein